MLKTNFMHNESHKNELNLKVFFILVTFSLLLISDRDLRFSLSFYQYPAFNTILSVLSIVLGTFILYRRSWIIDSVVVLLIMRTCLSIVTMMLMSHSFYASGKALCVLLVSILAYYVFLNKSKYLSLKSFSTLISLYLLVLSIQTIGSYYVNSTNNLVYAKSLVEIPIGRSNFIATHMLVCIVFLFYVKNKTKLHNIALTLGAIALLLTMSFGALIAAISISLIKTIFFYGGSKIKQVMILLSLSMVLLYSVSIYFPSYNYEEDSLTSSINRNISTKLTYFIEGNYDRLFSDRFLVYSEAWSRFLSSPVIGTFEGVNFREKTNVRAHNLFLESLSKYGIFGFVTLLIPIVIVLKRMVLILKNQRWSDGVYACFFALMVGVIHGLVEPNFFSLEFEFLWWSIAGFSVSQVKSVAFLSRSRGIQKARLCL